MKNRQFSSDDQQLLSDVMLHRRDIRGNNFLRTDVSNDIIDKIIASAALAPSVGFSQPWEFVIIRCDNIKKQISNSFEIENVKAKTKFTASKQQQYTALKLEGIREAPVNIAVFYKPASSPVLGQNSMPETGEYSVVCAIQNMWLMSRALNIGLGWVSILDSESVKTILKSPENNKLVAYLCIGYVKEFFDLPELEKLKWKQRTPIKSVVYQNDYSNSFPLDNGEH